MKKRLKGFTLIELLAVIVILAVILLIVIPIVLGVIEDSRKGSFESSTYGLAKTAENACMSYALRHDPVARETLFTDGEMTGYELNFTGKPPEGGYVHINEQCQVEMAVHNGEWCATKSYHEIEVTLTPYDGNCTLEEETYVQGEGRIELYFDSETAALNVIRAGDSRIAEEWTKLRPSDYTLGCNDYASSEANPGVAFDATHWGYGSNLLEGVFHIEIFSGIEHIGSSFFTISGSVTNNERTINIQVGLESMGEDSFNNVNLSGELILPDSVTTIGQQAFSANQITSVTIPESVTTIGWNAFAGNQIKSVTIPDNVTSLSGFANNQISSITIPESITTIGTNAFAGNQLTSITIPENVTTIGQQAFSTNQITSVTIPESVTTIGWNAFAGNQIKSVTIPDNVTSLSGFANNQISSITIPESITTIGTNAFAGNQLTSITIPENVTTIGQQAFSANQLTSVTFLRNEDTNNRRWAFRNNGPNGNSTASNLDCTTFNCSNNNNFYGTWHLNAGGTSWIKQ